MFNVFCEISLQNVFLICHWKLNWIASTFSFNGWVSTFIMFWSCFTISGSANNLFICIMNFLIFFLFWGRTVNNEICDAYSLINRFQAPYKIVSQLFFLKSPFLSLPSFCIYHFYYMLPSNVSIS